MLGAPGRGATGSAALSDSRQPAARYGAMMVAVELDADRCYEAVRARDGRFDGAFFTAVTTTGVYCRPICPSRLPRRRNVRFFAHAAAAEGAGFRPCRRCRPESAPGSPAWDRDGDVLARALALIDDGVLDEGSVVDLARRLDMADRHLRRLFAERLGTNPLAVARTRRAHLARRLLDETALPVTDVAFAAGFGSVRQFNDVMRATFGAAPSQLRHSAAHHIGGKGRGGSARSVAVGTPLSVRLPCRLPMDWEACMHLLASKTTPGVEQVVTGDVAAGKAAPSSVAAGEPTPRSVTAGEPAPGSVAAAYRRCVAGGWIAVRPGGARHLLLDVHGDGTRRLAGLVARARRMFDLDADTAAVAGLLGQDPVLAPLVARHPGLRLLGAWDGFEGAVRIIVGQLVSVRAASTTTGRLCRRYGDPVPGGQDGLDVLFPVPSALVGEELEACGMTRAKAGAIRALAHAVTAGDVALDGSMAPNRLEAALLGLPGVGPWTAAMVRMRVGRDPDAFVPGDLGVRRALGGVGAAEAEQRSHAWRPWRAYAAMYLWRSIT